MGSSILYPKFPADSIYLKVLTITSGDEITSLCSKQDVYKVPIISRDSCIYFLTGKSNKRTELYYKNRYDMVTLNSYSINQKSYNWSKNINDNEAEIISIIPDFIILSQNASFKGETPGNELFIYSLSDGQLMKRYKSKYSILQPLINNITDLDKNLPYYFFTGPLLIDLIDKKTMEKYSTLPICGTGIHYINDSIFVYTIVDVEDVYGVYWSVIDKEKGKSVYYKKAYKYTNIASIVTKVIASTFSNFMEYYTTYYDNPILEIFASNNARNAAISWISSENAATGIENLYRTLIPTRETFSNLCIDNMVTNKYFASVYINNKNISCLSVMTKHKKGAEALEFQMSDINQKPYLLNKNNDQFLLLTGDGKIQKVNLDNQNQSTIFQTEKKDDISLGLIECSDKLLLFTLDKIYCFNAIFE